LLPALAVCGVQLCTAVVVGVGLLHVVAVKLLALLAAAATQVPGATGTGP
jgi:hypothetical protein